MKTGILLGMCCLTAVSLSAQECVKVSAAKLNDYGLIYNLPRTQLDVAVKATRVTAKCGPYYNYAEKYLGVPVTITEDAEYWELNSVRATTSGVPDPAAEYVVRFKPGVPAFFCLNPAGVLLSVNEEPAIDSLKLEENAAQPAQPADTAVNFSVLSEELLLSGSTAKMAEVAAKQIYRIRESRLNLVTGEVDQLPADGESFKLVMKQLDEQEAALTALFLGRLTKKEVTYRIPVVPEEGADKNVLFRFSELLGLVGADNLAGEPVYLSVDVRQQGKAPVDKKGKTKPMPKNGLVYTIPGQAEVTLAKGGRELFRERFSFAQFGTVFSLDPALFKDKKGGVRVQFFPETGAIRQISQ